MVLCCLVYAIPLNVYQFPQRSGIILAQPASARKYYSLYHFSPQTKLDDDSCQGIEGYHHTRLLRYDVVGAVSNKNAKNSKGTVSSNHEPMLQIVYLHLCAVWRQRLHVL